LGGRENTMLLHEFNWKKEVLQASDAVLVDFGASWKLHYVKIDETCGFVVEDWKDEVG